MGCASVLFGTLTVLRITSSYPINISFSHPKAAFLVILSENRKFARWKSIPGGSNNAGKLIYSLSCVYWGEWTKEHSRLCDWANWQIGCKANAIKLVWIAEPQPMFSKKHGARRMQSNMFELLNRSPCSQRNMVQGECNQICLNCWTAAHVLKKKDTYKTV